MMKKFFLFISLLIPSLFSQTINSKVHFWRLGSNFVLPTFDIDAFSNGYDFSIAREKEEGDQSLLLQFSFGRLTNESRALEFKSLNLIKELHSIDLDWFFQYGIGVSYWTDRDFEQDNFDLHLSRIGLNGLLCTGYVIQPSLRIQVLFELFAEVEADNQVTSGVHPGNDREFGEQLQAGQLKLGLSYRF